MISAQTPLVFVARENRYTLFRSHALEQASLVSWFDDAPWRSLSGLLGRRFRRRRCCHHLAFIRCNADTAVGEFDTHACARPDIGGGMQRVAGLVAHQSEAARQHAAIGKRAQQLAAVSDPCRKPLRRGCKRATGALGQSKCAFAIARNRLTLRLCVRKL
jgi:hypothetical protein